MDRDKYKELAHNVNRFFEENINPALRAVGNFVSSVNNAVHQFRTNHAEQFKEMFERIGEAILETEEEINIFKKSIVEMGYPPPIDMDIGAMKAIAKEIKQSDVSTVSNYIDEFMISYFDDTTIDRRLQSWERTEHIRHRIPIIRNIIMAHKLKMFSLSTPAALAQIEGIIMEAFKVEGRTDNEILRIFLKELFANESENSFSFDRELHQYYIKNVLSSFEHGINLKSDLNRNAILHGYDYTYGTEVVSLKCILLLSYIIQSTEDIPSNLINVSSIKVSELRLRRKGKHQKQHHSKRPPKRKRSN